MADLPDFDAADLAGSILDLDKPATRELPATAPTPPATGAARGFYAQPGQASTPGSAIGWLLLVALFVAVVVAISLAVQLSPETGSPPEPPCGGLYSDCCFVDDAWVDCDPEPCDDFESPQVDDRRGLFDAEERFAERPPLGRC